MSAGRVLETIKQALATLLVPRPATFHSSDDVERRLELPVLGTYSPRKGAAVSVNRAFLSPMRAVRSVLFCAPAGDEMTDVALRAAELLAEQSRQRVAFVEEPGLRIALPESPIHPLITHIDWRPVPATVPRAGSANVALPATDRVVGTTIEDLLPAFAFVIVNVALPIETLVPLARQVDGVIVVIAQGQTQKDSAKKVVEALNADARLIGAILTVQ